MIQLLKKNNQLKNKIFFKSLVGNFKIYFVDNSFQIPKNIQIQIKDNNICFESKLGKLSLKFNNEILFFYCKNQLLLIISSQKNKKSILNLYNKLIKIKLKGILQSFKLNLILKGIGFKSIIENNSLNLKLGFSHPISVSIPSNIKINIQSNNLIFRSIDFIALTQFVFFIKNLKKPEPYKGKGLLLKNENIFRKEGKKSKK